MKITPEQKDFFEYGKARGILAEVRKEFVVSDVVFGISKQESITSFRKNLPLRHRLVKDAWQKRAACRAWVPLEKRECRTCSYLEEDFDSEICENCFIINSLASSCNWEPRKEGE